ncbi:MAG: hypothetical protein LUH10_12250 [Tannerellaceae bacterium]|nr:hypothetical protein [Tannerellaceae bacterium]
METSIKYIEEIHSIYRILRNELSNVKKYGLEDGKLGILLFLAEYSSCFDDKTLHQEIIDLANSWIVEIKDTCAEIDMTFLRGMPGIIWTYEKLVQKNFITIDTDACWAHYDKAVHLQLLIFPIILDEKDIPFGQGLYFLNRLKNEDSLSELKKKYILLQLIDEVERILVHKKCLREKEIELTFSAFISLVYFLKKTKELCLFPYKVDPLVESLSVISTSIQKRDLVDVLFYHLLSTDSPPKLSPFQCTRIQLEENIIKAANVAVLFDATSVFNDFLSLAEFHSPDLLMEIISKQELNTPVSLSIIGCALIRTVNNKSI